MVDHPLPAPGILGNGQSDATIYLLDDELTDDGACGSVFSNSCRFVLITTAVPRSRINCRAIAPPLTLAVKTVFASQLDMESLPWGCSFYRIWP